jgi:peptide/nickel transport system ATP-binding protein
MIGYIFKKLGRVVTNMNELLKINNLKTYFFKKNEALPAVDGIDLSIKKGETLAIVGESGCGKSMTSLSIMGLVPGPSGRIIDGEILYNGKDLCALTEDEMLHIRGKEIAMIFQEPMTSLNPVLTIGDQITESLRLHMKMSKPQARERAEEMLKLVGFARAKEILDEHPHKLSGGMRQRVMIAMAMACNPKLLIADEPTTALDVTIQAQILELMKDVREKFNTSILLITHDLGVVAEMADRVIVMYAGKVVEEGTVEGIFENPQHPYTKGLLASIPSLEDRKERLYSIKGNVPIASEMPMGCRFAPRCDYAMDRCHSEQPGIIEIKQGHLSRCFLHEDGETA